MQQNRWMINKIGLINFWYYDEEEFLFEDGRLLLRGSNGSGKSVTMQSFIPLLLDGNKSPDRLDPFGSRARRIENYLLGDDDDAKEENTGYLYMEFKKTHSEHYLTIGIGMRARKNKPLDFWGFAITDGRRIGQDFLLYKQLGEKIPLSKQELKNRLSSGGEYHEGTKDYMSMVNKLLFGFENLDDYDELVKLLIQIRTPKLSKEFKPTVLYEIMNNSLQPLTDDDLRPMSEAIENMDNIKSQIDVLRESKKACDKIKMEYDKYNRFVLFEKSRDFVLTVKKSEDTALAVKREETELLRAEQEKTRFESEYQSLKIKKEALEHKREGLMQHDAYKAKQELETIKEEIQKNQKTKEEKDKQHSEKKDRERRFVTEIKQHQNNLEALEEAFDSTISQMGEIAEEVRFFEHEFSNEEILAAKGKEYKFDALTTEAYRYRDKLSETRKTLEKEKVVFEEYDRASKELEVSKRRKTDAMKQNEKAEVMLLEAKEDYIEKIYSWIKENIELKIESNKVSGVIRVVNSYGEGFGFDDIRQEIRYCYDEVKASIDSIVNDIRIRSKEIKNHIDQKKQEQKEWEDKRDPEPIRELKISEGREKLTEHGIPYIPFYKAIDFNKDVQENIKGRIEEALLDMGVLDALIVPKAFLEKAKSILKDNSEKIITPNPQHLRHTLAMFMKPEAIEPGGGIDKSLIDDVLRSFVLDDKKSGAFINEKGEYTIGIIEGKVSGKVGSKFIGVEARRKFRMATIEKIKDEILKLKELVDEQDDLMKIETKRLIKLDEEFKLIPTKADLDTGLQILRDAKNDYEVCNKEFKLKEEFAENKYKQLKEIRDMARELISKLELGNNLADYEEAEKSMQEYIRLLNDLGIRFEKINSAIRLIQATKDSLEQIQADIDNILYDITMITRSLSELNAKRLNFEEILQKQNFEEIKNEIEACVEGLKRIPNEMEESLRKSEEYKALRIRCGENLEKLTVELGKLSSNASLHEDLFIKEESLRYLNFDGLGNVTETKKRALKIYQELKHIEKEPKTREELGGNLQNKYHENRQFFTEYNLIMISLFDKVETTGNTAIDSIINASRRYDFSAKIQGKDVNFVSLVQFIEESLEENEKLLKEGDRQLFEDVLANTIGKKIRARIYHSEKWVEKMNQLMESMNTSSGLSFSLVWKNKKAETEEQMGTRELVDILKSDNALLTPEQMDSLARHFRSKIQEARKLLEIKGTDQSFHSIIKEVLDYRNWFEFQLYFRKTNESKRELTNVAFFKFSGGEKAMAMYVPLFSAVYAKYEGARKESPRIISLDEAFAGVDENNIRDMFRLLEELKLSFIINSQILWGDYDTVPGLSICELIRPNNADFVTVIRYKWNGNVKILLR